ncbi:ROK family protein [Sphingobacterium pedocola]|uniref:ROK family protein n=1 Tax=Sphingobacterium pedocola TaxID=2082722 RepID=A0ABR9TAR6_9SPHI|nr:ROK family protein [Sphingobacterium pedocola]MBE8722431.1 ROK family protein [Sphingobacterium pedocola]
MSDNKNYILACDIGGTHITSAIVVEGTWEILSSTIKRVSFNSQENAKSIFQYWADNIQNCLNEFNDEITQIGIAMPGPFDYENGIALMKGQNKYDSIYKLNTTEGILNALKDKHMEIRYINDAAAFLQGEIFASKRNNEDRILGITLGTGLGSAVWSNNEKAYDADLWNSPYKRTIFEEYLVTRWFVNRFLALSGSKEPGFKEITQHHENTEALEQLLAEYRKNLKDFLHFFSEKYESKKFIIGGNITKAWDLINKDRYFEDFEINLGKYEEKAAIIGAASLFQ